MNNNGTNNNNTNNNIHNKPINSDKDNIRVMNETSLKTETVIFHRIQTTCAIK